MKKYIKFGYDFFMGGDILPNAYNRKLGEFRYLRSFGHINSNTNIDFTDNIKKTFGENVYAPTTIDGSVFDTKYYMNREFAFERGHIRNTEKYIYLIKPEPTFYGFLGISSNGTITNLPFWRFITRDAMSDLKSNRALLVIDYTMEPFIPVSHYELFTRAIRDSEIPFRNIMILVNSFNAKEYYEKIRFMGKPPRNESYKIRNLPFCLEYASYHYGESIKMNKKNCISLNEFESVKRKRRKYKFLMHVKATRKRRLEILDYLFEHEYTKYGDYSLLIDEGERYKLNPFSHLKGISKLPKNLESESYAPMDINAWSIHGRSFENPRPYVNSYFNICCETIFDESDMLSLTEKIFKPIVNFQPFILVGGYNFINLLKKLGFKTFDPFINESYDNEEDPIQRMLLIKQEIDKLCNMPYDELHEWYLQMEDILVHNHKHLLSHLNGRIHSDSILEELYDFVR